MADEVTEAFRLQDRAEKLGFFSDGVHIGDVPPHDTYGEKTRAEAASRAKVNPNTVEVLLVCPDHAGFAAVDCPEHEDWSDR